MESGFSIREQSGQTARTTCTVRVGDGQDIPRSMMRCEFTEDGIPLFLGFVGDVTSPTFSTGYEVKKYSLKVNAADIMFTWKLVSEAFLVKKTHEIVQELFTTYIETEGFTLGTITEFDRSYQRYIVPRLRLQDVLQELGDEVGAVAHIDASGAFNFVDRSSLETIDAPAHITAVQITESGRNLRTVQYVSGAKAETTQQTRSTVWGTDQKEQVLAYQLSDEPGATVNGSVVNVGIKGVDNEDETKTFLYKIGDNVIALNPNATTQPVGGDIVVFLYNGFYNIEVEETNENLRTEIAELSGTSGTIETLVVDTSIETQQDGQDKAGALLRTRATRDISISLECTDVAASALLKQWYFNRPEFGLVGTYAIVERSITDRYDGKQIKVKLIN